MEMTLAQNVSTPSAVVREIVQKTKELIEVLLSTIKASIASWIFPILLPANVPEVVKPPKEAVASLLGVGTFGSMRSGLHILATSKGAQARDALPLSLRNIQNLLHPQSSTGYHFWAFIIDGLGTASSTLRAETIISAQYLRPNIEHYLLQNPMLSHLSGTDCTKLWCAYERYIKAVQKIYPKLVKVSVRSAFIPCLSFWLALPFSFFLASNMLFQNWLNGNSEHLEDQKDSARDLERGRLLELFRNAESVNLEGLMDEELAILRKYHNERQETTVCLEDRQQRNRLEEFQFALASFYGLGAYTGSFARWTLRAFSVVFREWWSILDDSSDLLSAFFEARKAQKEMLSVLGNSPVIESGSESIQEIQSIELQELTVNVTAGSKDQCLLNKVSIPTLKGPCFVVVVGENGAGKTTLLKTLLRELPIEDPKGDFSYPYKINGKPAKSFDLKELRKCMAYGPSELRFFPSRTLRDNLIFPFTPNETMDALLKEKLIPCTGVKTLCDKNFDLLMKEQVLSTGQKRAIMHVRTFLKLSDRGHKPSLILVDEGENGMEELTALPTYLNTLINLMLKSNSIVFFVAHNMRVLHLVHQRLKGKAKVLEMAKGGNVVQFSSTQAFLTNPERGVKESELTNHP